MERVRNSVELWRGTVALLVSCHVLANFPVDRCAYVDNIKFAAEFMMQGASRSSGFVLVFCFRPTANGAFFFLLVLHLE